MAATGARVAYHAYRAGADLARRLPPALADPTGRLLARSMVVAWPARRRQVRRNLRRVTAGALQGAALERAVSSTFANYARYWLDLFRLASLPAAEIDSRFEVEGFEHLLDARDAGRGAVVALPHLGHWDFAGAWLASQGYDVTVVAEPVEPPELFAWFTAIRERLGLDVVTLDRRAGAKLLRALSANRFVCLLCDRDLSGDGVEVEFFGERTRLPGGPATLALRTGAPLVPVGVHFLADGRYGARVLPPVPMQRAGRLADDAARVTQDLARRFEDLIRAAPEEWLVMQPNWPSDTADGRHPR